MINLSAVIKMLKDIDSMLDRTSSKSSLSYDTTSLKYIIKQGYVTLIGDKVTRKFHGYNYDCVC